MFGHVLIVFVRVYFAINRPKTCVVSNRQVKMLFSAILSM